ncbi:phosphoserine phosphatase SerB [Oceanibacterium hippocampi]|uniref:phosphoserine phosphatase SerB n=1 Tax=Oceanibacterium hippocampi TaxID=745714 RepID=UPI000A26A880|nr:phosphoserine phosphatase SerB [Oceanibacterium hippocampi]
MRYVLTLVAGTGETLSETDIEHAGETLRGAGGDTGPAIVLAPRKAVDIPLELEPENTAAARNALAQALAARPIDWLLQAAAGRRKRLLVADMDSTIITVECIDELADFAGRKAEVAEITERAMRGELDFAGALRARVAMLGGLTTDVLLKCFEDRIRLTPGARSLVATMRANGAYTALVSGGFTFFTSRVREMVGFDWDQANRLGITDGRLSGEVEEPILGADGKLVALRRIEATRGIAATESLAIGDGANDIPMLQAAGLGIAFHAKPKTAAAAEARVDHGDLATPLFFQGYRHTEIVNG